jgi:glutaminase
MPREDGLTHPTDTYRSNHAAVLVCFFICGAFPTLTDVFTRIQIKRLVENFVDINSADYDSRTALHLAASNGHMNVLEYLASDKDIKLDPEDRVKGTPLQDAINHGHAAVQRFLKDKGATVRAPVTL